MKKAPLFPAGLFLVVGYIFLFPFYSSAQTKPTNHPLPLLQDTATGYAPMSLATLVLMKGGKKKPMLQYHDYLDNLVFLPDFGGSDSIQLSFRNFLIVSNTYNGSAPFIVLPNDRIQVGIDSAGWLVLETGNPVRNAELNLFPAMVKSGSGNFDIDLAFNIMKGQTYARRDSVLDGRLNKGMAFFEVYSANPLLRPEIVKVSRQYLLHQAQFEKFLTVSNRGGSEEELKLEYAQLAKYLQSQSRYAYYFPHFKFVASLALNYGYVAASAVKPKKAEWASAKEFRANLNLTKSFFDSSLVEPLQYLLLKSPLNQKLANHKEEQTAYANRYPGTDFTRHLLQEQAYRESIDKNFKGNQLVGQKDVSVALEDMIARKRGKVLYVDFWASWCVPCLEEIPHSMEMKEKFKGQAVEFVYLSVDKNKAAWAKGQQRYPKALQTANSFLLLQEFNSPFAKGLRLQAIPRYIIIDKTGKIVNADAPRPSEPDLLEKELKALLR